MKRAVEDLIRMVLGLPADAEVPTIGIVIFISMLLFFAVVFAALNYGL
jgi:hypothetical protein